MTIELTDPSKRYEMKHPSGAAFVMRHWTNGMQDDLERRYLALGEAMKTVNAIALEREVKLELALEGWSGVTSDGQEVPCTPENKKMLPVGVILWIVQEIDERAGLRLTLAEKKI